MQPSNRGGSVYGPYVHRSRWRVILIDIDGGRTARVCETLEQANELIRRWDSHLDDGSRLRVISALDRYGEYLKHKGNRTTSIATTIFRLPQLRISEARAWMRVATKLADRGESGGVAAMMALLMGMRCSEIVRSVARDVDDRGQLLWIPLSKTEAGKRVLEIPPLVSRSCAPTRCAACIPRSRSAPALPRTSLPSPWATSRRELLSSRTLIPLQSRVSRNDASSQR
jgi:integrase